MNMSAPKYMITKEGKIIYILEDPRSDYQLFSNVLHEMGYEVRHLDHINDFFNVLKSGDKHGAEEPSPENSLLVHENVEMKKHKDLILQIHSNSQWLISMMNNMNIGFVLSDQDYTLMYNKVIKDITGCSPEEMTGSGMEKAIGENDKNKFHRTLKKILNREKGKAKAEVQILEKSGGTSKANMLVLPLEELDRKPLLVQYISCRNGEKDLSQEQWEALIHELHDILYSISRINGIKEQSKYVKGRMSGWMSEELDKPELTFREKQILKYIYKGYTSQKIGHKLGISSRTVESHRSNILHKTHARNTADLIRYAIKNGFIE